MSSYSIIKPPLRCAITKNPCGTDTWRVGSPCECPECTAWLEIHALRAKLAKWNTVIAAGCTPSGSEYHDDPERCAVFLKDVSDTGHEAKKDRVKLRRENESLRLRVQALGAVVEDALLPGVFGDFGFIEEPSIPPIVGYLCDKLGYGAMMGHISALWEKKHSGSGYTCAACTTIRRQWIASARKALTPSPADPKESA